MQLWPEMPVHAGWQGSQHHGSIRRDPALASVTDRFRTMYCTTNVSQPLKRESGGTCALITRSSMATRGAIFPRRRRLPRLPARFSSPALHAAWFDPRSAVQTLQSRMLFPQFRDQPILVSHLAQQLQHQRLQRLERQAINVSRGGRSQVESTRTASAQAKSQPTPQVLPLLRLMLRKLCNPI